MGTKLVISMEVELPSDVLESAQAQVAVLTPFKAFVAEMSKIEMTLPFTHTVSTVADGATPAAQVVVARQPRGAPRGPRKPRTEPAAPAAEPAAPVTKPGAPAPAWATA